MILNERKAFEADLIKVCHYLEQMRAVYTTPDGYEYVAEEVAPEAVGLYRRLLQHGYANGWL